MKNEDEIWNTLTKHIEDEFRAKGLDPTHITHHSEEYRTAYTNAIRKILSHKLQIDLKKYPPERNNLEIYLKKFFNLPIKETDRKIDKYGYEKTVTAITIMKKLKKILDDDVFSLKGRLVINELDRYGWDLDKWIEAIKKRVFQIEKRKENRIYPNSEEIEDYNEDKVTTKKISKKKYRKRIITARGRGKLMLRLHPSGKYYYFGEPEDIKRELEGYYYQNMKNHIRNWEKWAKNSKEFKDKDMKDMEISIMEYHRREKEKYFQDDLDFFSGKYYTVPLLCELHNLNTKTVYNLIKKRKIKYVNEVRFIPYRQDKSIRLIPESELKKVLKVCGRKTIFKTWLEGITKNLGYSKSNGKYWGARKFIERVIKKGIVDKNYFFENKFNEIDFSKIKSASFLHKL